MDGTNRAGLLELSFEQSGGLLRRGMHEVKRRGKERGADVCLRNAFGVSQAHVVPYWFRTR
jgi:hypothetical protein